MLPLIASAITPQTINLAMQGLEILSEAEDYAPVPALPSIVSTGPNRYAVLKEGAPAARRPAPAFGYRPRRAAGYTPG